MAQAAIFSLYDLVCSTKFGPEIVAKKNSALAAIKFFFFNDF